MNRVRKEERKLSRSALRPRVLTYPYVARCGLLATQVVLVEKGPQLRLQPLQGLEMAVKEHHHVHHGKVLAQKREQGPKES